MLAGPAGSWQVFQLMYGTLLYSGMCEIPWGKNILLTLQVAEVEAAACPLPLHTPSPGYVCMLFILLAAQEILSFYAVRTQSLAAFRF